MTMTDFSCAQVIPIGMSVHATISARKIGTKADFLKEIITVSSLLLDFPLFSFIFPEIEDTFNDGRMPGDRNNQTIVLITSFLLARFSP
jgi:hypothetical protein